MQEMAVQMSEVLVSKKAMLFEYFSLEITNSGDLVSLPLLLGMFYYCHYKKANSRNKTSVTILFRSIFGFTANINRVLLVKY